MTFIRPYYVNSHIYYTSLHYYIVPCVLAILRVMFLISRFKSHNTGGKILSTPCFCESISDRLNFVKIIYSDSARGLIV
jgi:hypothetical protein